MPLSKTKDPEMKVKELPDIIPRAVMHKCPFCKKEFVSDLNLTVLKRAYK